MVSYMWNLKKKKVEPIKMGEMLIQGYKLSVIKMKYIFEDQCTDITIYTLAFILEIFQE